MKKITIGILAHVDAGKTTLSEGLLYLCGCIRRIGRVDHGDSFLDTNALERSRGITIFSKQAILETEDTRFYLLDTPGHTDFSAEAERTLSVLDYAILVISASDGVQVHTETLWRLLDHRHIPVFLFVNKTDLPCFDRDAILSGLRTHLSEGCTDFSLLKENAGVFYEEAALCSEALTEEYLEKGELSPASMRRAIRQREIFPVSFGSALRLEGVSQFLSLLSAFTEEEKYPESFGARVFKIGRDPAGARLTYLKLTGGSLRVKDSIGKHSGDELLWEEKAEQIRFYSGEKYRSADTAGAGDICAVTGLSHTLPGMGLGETEDSGQPILEPVLSYRLVLPEGVSAKEAYPRILQFAEEDPLLHLHWDPVLHEISVSLMGEIQMDILTHEIKERLGYDVSFDTGEILYHETISSPVECAGHYEPLRHYAEVHLLLEPGEPGSGVTFDSLCPVNVLAQHWQRLILSQLEEELPMGVLTGSAVTDLHIILTGGRAHLKHTEGGDFLQAASRAFRQGLMKAKEAGQAVLLEPWYEYRLTLPDPCIGRAMNDFDRMCGTVKEVRSTENGMSVLTGCVPSSEVLLYHTVVQAYTRGKGTLVLSPHGAAPCHNAEAVTAARNYDAERDISAPADSVFCRAGAGYAVSWREADAHMHTESVLAVRKSSDPVRAHSGRSVSKPRTYAEAAALDRELREIFERTYGPISPRSVFVPPPPPVSVETRETYLEKLDPTEEYVLVDGYNIIFAWEELTALARDSLDLARSSLIHILANYQGFRKCNLILVFDAYKVSGGVGSVERHAGIHVIYTRQKETADSYIERVTYDIGKSRRVRVATSDGLEQIIVLGHGAERVSARSFREEVMAAADELRAVIDDLNAKNR